VAALVQVALDRLLVNALGDADAADEAALHLLF
jgi:hypothetical protein